MSLNDDAAKFYRDEVNGVFQQGRGFRTFKELNIEGSGAYVIKIVASGPAILTGLDLAIESGNLKVETVAGGTPAGTFAEVLPIIKSNLMVTTPYVSKLTLTAGGTHTGGTVIDVIRMKTDGNNTRAASVATTETTKRGVAPGTYHYRITNLSTDSALGTFKITWEEPQL